MISLTCTSCQAVLLIDDAFVGGVCRCQHCGAIQTVPSHLKAGATRKKVKTQKTLYRKSVRDEAGGVPSSGLDELAQVVTSSGLSSARLEELRDVAPGRKRNRKMPLLLVGGAVMAMLVVVGTIWFASRPTKLQAGGSEAAPAPVIGHAVPVPAAAVLPNFLGVKLEAPTVIYLLDRGNGTQAMFSSLLEAAYKSAGSLGSERKFQILFWDNQTSDEAYPRTGPTFATPGNIEAARRALDAVIAQGQSDIGPPLQKAMDANPSIIVIATGKGASLDNDFAEQVLAMARGRSIPIHTFDLGATTINKALETISNRTGGHASVVSEADLRNFVRN